MANGNRIKELLELEKVGKLSDTERNAITTLRGRGEFPPALVPTQAETQVTIPEAPAAPEKSWGRWAAEEALPMGGAIGGALLGSVTSPFTGPVGPMVGAGAGAMAGRAANPTLFKLFGAEPPPQPTGTELLTEGGLTMLGEGAGRLLATGGKAVGKMMFPEPPSNAGTLREAFAGTGVTPKPSDVSPSRGISMTERALVQTPAQGTITGRAMKQGAQLEEAGERFLGGLGPQAERGPAGQAVADAIEANVDKWRAMESNVWERGITPRARGMLVDVRNFKLEADKLLDIEMRMAPGQRNEAMIQTLKSIVDTKTSKVPYMQVRAWQQGFGRSLAGGEKGLVSNFPAGEAKHMYDSALSAIEAEMTRADPQLASLFTRAREISREGNELFRSRNLRNVTDADPEKVVQMIQGTGGPSAIQRAKRAILGDPSLGGQPDQAAWDTARRHILEGIIGGAKRDMAGQAEKVISGAALERNIERIGRDTLKELLSPDELKALDQLMTVSKAIRRGERFGAAPGTSSTAGALGLQGILAGTGAAIGGSLGGPVGGAAGAVASNFLVPAAMARLVTSPGVAKMLLSPAYAKLFKTLETGGKISGEGMRMLGRLGGVAAGHEAAQEEE